MIFENKPIDPPRNSRERAQRRRILTHTTSAKSPKYPILLLYTTLCCKHSRRGEFGRSCSNSLKSFRRVGTREFRPRGWASVRASCREKRRCEDRVGGTRHNREAGWPSRRVESNQAGRILSGAVEIGRDGLEERKVAVDEEITSFCSRLEYSFCFIYSV